METPIRRTYPSDLTDAQWAILEPLVPASKHGGRPRTVDMREIINTILYLNRTGCQWDTGLPSKTARKDYKRVPAPTSGSDCIEKLTM